MRVLITGAGGFIGQRLTQALLGLTSQGHTDHTNSTIELVLCDAAQWDAPVVHENAQILQVIADLGDAGAIENIFQRDFDVIFHLAAVVSAAAEEDFELGMRVNFELTRALLEAARHQKKQPKFIMASSVAVFGGDMPAVITDHTAATPQSSYGTQKAMCELLVNDYNRKGFIEGLVLRLPTVVVRPGKPNKAASTFASSIIREPLKAEMAICPVPPQTPMFISSPKRIVESLLHAFNLERNELGSSCILNLPGLTVTVEEMINALVRIKGEEIRKFINWENDPKIRTIVESWPAKFKTSRALSLGFSADGSMDEIIANFIQDQKRH
jgi:nucleoside-diphosphate-sugar epimerase